MCGLVAAFNKDGIEQISVDDVKKMNQAIHLRGPDDHGMSIEKYAVLGHRRLSIIDVESGQQPMWSDKCAVGIVFNGEIYNHVALRSEMASKGCVFKSHSDTEVILNGYMMYGEGIFARLDGMFAVVIYDSIKRKMVIARDRYGIKPLYQKMLNNGTFLFASEYKAISAYGHFNGEDVQAVENYLHLGFMVEGRSFEKGVHQIRPGTCMTIDFSGAISVNTYWCTSHALSDDGAVPTDEEGLALLRNAVSSQSIADPSVKVGSFLSGGLDSSIVTTLLTEVHAKHGQKLHCYTAGFNDKKYDESELAKELAHSLGNQHSKIMFGEDMMSQLSELNMIYSGPFADNAALPTYHISKLARKDVKVLLSGDGADELFFGYRNHKSMMMEDGVRSKIPDTIKANVLPWLAENYPNSPKMPRVLRAKSTLKSLSMDLGSAYCSALSLTSRDVLESLYSEYFKQELQGYRTEHDFKSIGAEVSGMSPMKVIQHLDFKTYLPGAILTKVDRATMAAGVEARVPFLNNDLVDRVLTLDSSHNLGANKNKALLRRWGGRVLPRVVEKREKKSFTSPLDIWFRSLPLSVFCSIIMTEKLLSKNIFNSIKIKKLIEDHHSGRANHGPTLWSIAVLAN